jgi:hypothetical protein
MALAAETQDMEKIMTGRTRPSLDVFVVLLAAHPLDPTTPELIQLGKAGIIDL